MSASGDLRSACARALELSQQMLRAAENAEWDNVTALEAQRAQVLAAAFPTAEATAFDAASAEILRQVLRLNEEIQARAASARDECGATLEQLRKGRQAVAGYTQVLAVR